MNIITLKLFRKICQEIGGSIEKTPSVVSPDNAYCMRTSEGRIAGYYYPKGQYVYSWEIKAPKNESKDYDYVRSVIVAFARKGAR